MSLYVSPYAIGLIVAAAGSLSLFYTFLKKFKGNVILLYFWIHFTTYLIFTGLYFFEQSLPLFNVDTYENFFFTFTYQNFPFYLLYAICLLASHLILQQLITLYPVATIIGISQLSILFSAIGYILLGDIVTTISVIGIITICIGALISGLPTFSFKHPLKSFSNYNFHLLYLCGINAFLQTMQALITYLCTAQSSSTTKSILHHLTKHLHIIPFASVIPVHFNIGVQFANMILILGFIIFYLHKSTNIITLMKKQWPLIAQICTCYILYAYLFYTAFDMIENKNIISATLKIYLPLTLLLSYITLHEKISRPQIIGMSIIIIGSTVTIFG